MVSDSQQPELDTAIRAATEAGRVVRDLYDRSAAATYAKADGSLVTDADLAADRLIRAILAEQFPADPILTEEVADDPARLAARRLWIVDPIDGTDQFVRRTDDFDVFVALVVDGRPVVAAAYQPPTATLCAAVAGGGAWLRVGDGGQPTPLRLSPPSATAPPNLATSVWFGAPSNAPTMRRLADRLGAEPPAVETIGFSPRVLLPPRPYHAYIGFRPETEHAMGWEWDFVVGDLVIHEAGGIVTDLAGEPHRYNKPNLRNRPGLLAAVDPATHHRVLAALHETVPGLA